MLKYITATLLSVSLLLTIYSCNKNNNSSSDDKDVDIDSGKFLVQVDSTKWHPAYHNAIYYSKWNQLYIKVKDRETWAMLEGGVNLDSINPLKKYPLLPNGDDAFSYTNNLSNSSVVDLVTFYTNLNMAGSGGSFTITRFDTVKKNFSGILEFTAYDSYKSRKVKIATTTIEDIPFTINTMNYNGSNASCTIQGVTTTDRQSKDLTAQVNCASGSVVVGQNAVTNEIMDINIFSILHGSQLNNIYIRMPVSKTAGKYEVYPNVAPYIYCGDKHVVSTFTDGKYNRKYMAVSGEFNVLSIDSLNRKLEATYNIQYQDNDTKEILNISNGKISLKNWGRMGDH
jgi:hypothetical protein